jgi:hypothetical protein
MERVHLKMYLFNTKGSLTEIRRINVPPKLQWSELCGYVRDMVDAEFTLEYKDPEGDMVTVSSEAEWNECLQIGTYQDGEPPLRLHIKKCKAKKDTEDKEVLKKQKSDTKGKSRCSGSGSDTLEPNLFYTTDNTPLPEHQRLQEIQASVAPILQQYFPVDWDPTNFDVSLLPNWLQAAVKLVKGTDAIDLDISIPILEGCLNARAIFLMGQNKYCEALPMLENASKLVPSCRTTYNIACCFALMGVTRAAIKALSKAVEQGYNNLSHMLADDDLESLRHTRGFLRLVKRLQGTNEDLSSSDDSYEVVDSDEHGVSSSPVSTPHTLATSVDSIQHSLDTLGGPAVVAEVQVQPSTPCVNVQNETMLETEVEVQVDVQGPSDVEQHSVSPVVEVQEVRVEVMEETREADTVIVPPSTQIAEQTPPAGETVHTAIHQLLSNLARQFTGKTEETAQTEAAVVPVIETLPVVTPVEQPTVENQDCARATSVHNMIHRILADFAHRQAGVEEQLQHEASQVAPAAAPVVETPHVDAPVEQPSVMQPFHEKRLRLMDMGFMDDDLNLQLLTSCEGNLQVVVDRIVNIMH